MSWFFAKEGIVGNRTFALVPEASLMKFLKDRQKIPHRLTQTSEPKLAQFQTIEAYDKTLVFRYRNNLVSTSIPLEVQEIDIPLISHVSVPNDMPLIDIFEDFAFPIKPSRSSSHIVWAMDCGELIAETLTEILGKKMRLFKALKSESSTRETFSWFAAMHAVSWPSVLELSSRVGQTIDIRIFRADVIFRGDTPFAEEVWRHIFIKEGVEAAISQVVRCAYIAMGQDSPDPRAHAPVLTQISESHNKKFGVYIEPPKDGTLVFRPGDTFKVSS